MEKTRLIIQEMKKLGKIISVVGKFAWQYLAQCDREKALCLQGLLEQHDQACPIQHYLVRPEQ
jgi:hypothetical protein